MLSEEIVSKLLLENSLYFITYILFGCAPGMENWRICAVNRSKKVGKHCIKKRAQRGSLTELTWQNYCNYCQEKCLVLIFIFFARRTSWRSLFKLNCCCVCLIGKDKVTSSLGFQKQIHHCRILFIKVEVVMEILSNSHIFVTIKVTRLNQSDTFC